jgi:hypothetical protein
MIAEIHALCISKAAGYLDVVVLWLVVEEDAAQKP